MLFFVKFFFDVAFIMFNVVFVMLVCECVFSFV